MTTTVPFGFNQTFPAFAGQPVPFGVGFGGFVPGYTGAPVGATTTGFTPTGATTPTGQTWAPGAPGAIPTADQAAGVQSFSAQPVTPFSTFPTSFFGYPTASTTPWTNWSPSFGYSPTSFGGTPFGYTPSFAQGFYGQTTPAFQPFNFTTPYSTFGTPFSSFGTPFSSFGSTPWTTTASTPWSTFGFQSTPWSSYSPFSSTGFGSPFTSSYGGFQSPWGYSPFSASTFSSTPWASTPWSSTPWSFAQTPWTNSWTSTPWASSFSGFGGNFGGNYGGNWGSFTQPFSSWTTPGAWAGYTGNTFASFPQTFPTVSPFAYSTWPQNSFYTPSFFNWSAPFGYGQPVPFATSVDGSCDRGQRRGFGIREAA